MAKGNQPGGEPGADDEVPKIGRGPLFRRRRKPNYLPAGQIITIFALLLGLFAVVTMKDSCARGAENLFRAFDVPPDGGAAGTPVPKP
jgi:hypothetical protein